MFSTVLYLTLSSVIFLNLKDLQVNADVDVEALSKTVTEHTTILNQFPTHVGNVKAIEKQIEELQPRITVIEAHTRNLQSDLSELTGVSIAYTERLDNFVAYQKKTDKLEYDVAQLLETVDTYGGSLNALELYKKRTNLLEDNIININDELKNNSIAINAISKDVENFHNICAAEQDNIDAEIKKINVLQIEQEQMSNKLDSFVKDLDTRKNETLKSFSILQESCIAEQHELKTKVQKLDTVVEIQEDTKKKLNNLITSVEDHKTTITGGVQSLKDNVTITQNQVKIEIQKIEPLTKTQDETTNKLNDLVNSLTQLKNDQNSLKNSLKELSDQFEVFLRGHTTPTTTLAPTPDPNSVPIIIRKHIHARGNNIVVTI